jgi:hypothetical protein
MAALVAFHQAWLFALFSSVPSVEWRCLTIDCLISAFVKLGTESFEDTLLDLRGEDFAADAFEFVDDAISGLSLLINCL